MILKILDNEKYSIVNLDNVDILELNFIYNFHYRYIIHYQQQNLPQSCSFHFTVPLKHFENMERGRKLLNCIFDMCFNRGIIDKTREKYWIEEFKNEDWITIEDNQIIIDLTLK